MNKIRDIFVLWNDVIEADNEGLLIEVYNGRGDLIERIRLISDGDDAIFNLPTLPAMERMVRAYAAGYWDRYDVTRGAKFQVHYCPEID